MEGVADLEDPWQQDRANFFLRSAEREGLHRVSKRPSGAPTKRNRSKNKMYSFLVAYAAKLTVGVFARGEHGVRGASFLQKASALVFNFLVGGGTSILLRFLYFLGVV